MIFRALLVRTATIVIVACCLTIALTAEGEAQDHVVQYSSGQCSVNIANVSGNVTVEAGCMDQKVVALFLDTINRQQKDYQEKAKEVELWIKRYDELSARLGTTGAFSHLREEVKRRFKEGDLAGAGRAKEQIIAAEEGFVDELAADYYERAEMLVLEMKPLEAQRFYAKAFQYRPQSAAYAESYARNLCDTQQREKAQAVYQISANELRSLSKGDPAKYSADLTCTLVNIAGLYFVGGAYEQARSAADEALEVASRISPKDGRVAQEHTANALTSVGLIAIKQGRIQEGKERLTRAEEIFSTINVTNANRPILFEALAGISKDENNREEEEKELTKALIYEKKLTEVNYMDHRSKLAQKLYLLFDFYISAENLDKSRLLQSEFTTFISSLSTANEGTRLFLSATSQALLCEQLIAENKSESARPLCISAIQNLESIRASLRVRESTILSRAYCKLAWLNLKGGEYQSALEAFDKAIKVNLDVNGLQMRRAATDRRIAQFFVADFATAATDLLSHSDGMSAYDKAMWNLLIRKRADPSARLEEQVQAKSDNERILADVASGRSPLSLLTTALNQISGSPDTDERCRLAFYAGELLALANERSQGVAALGRCVETNETAQYAWVVAATKLYWSKRN